MLRNAGRRLRSGAKGNYFQAFARHSDTVGVSSGDVEIPDNSAGKAKNIARD